MQDDRAVRMEKDLASRLYIVDKMKKDTDQTAKEVGDLKDVVKALETKTEDHDRRIFDTNAELETLKMNCSITQQTARNLEDRVTKLEGSSENHEDRIKSLEDMVKDALDRLRGVE